MTDLKTLADAARRIERIVAEANEPCNRPGQPTLAVTSTREQLIAWLIWCDPNGRWTDEDNERDGWEPINLGEAWQAIQDMAKEAA